MARTTALVLPCFGITIERTMEEDAMGISIHSQELLGPGGPDNTVWGAAIDTMLTMVLAHYNAGVDVTAAEYIEGIETAVGNAMNQWGDN